MAKGPRGRGPQGGMGNMQQLMQQAQRMQAAMEEKKQALDETIHTAASGGGMVAVEVNGAHKIISIKIDPEAVDPDDVEMLEDLVLAAINEAMEIADRYSDEEMAKITGGMNMPGMR